MEQTKPALTKLQGLSREIANKNALPLEPTSLSRSSCAYFSEESWGGVCHLLGLSWSTLPAPLWWQKPRQVSSRPQGFKTCRLSALGEVKHTWMSAVTVLFSSRSRQWYFPYEIPRSSKCCLQVSGVSHNASFAITALKHLYAMIQPFQR